MIPAQLTAAAFSKLPLQARALAVQYLDVLKQMPLPLAVTMIREISSYDWQFPAERRNLESQFVWFRTLPEIKRQQVSRGFEQLSLSSDLLAQDWVNRSLQFNQSMTAYLWATHQIDAFRTAATDYALAWREAVPDPAPLMPRLCIVVLGEGIQSADYSLFQKLRPHGVFFSKVNSVGGMQAIYQTIEQRVAKQPAPYEHWYIDGGSGEPWSNKGLTNISWQELDPLRKVILQRMQIAVAEQGGGPEKLQTILEDITLAEVGISSNKDEILNRFAVDIFTGGSGTQVYNTTFAQWTAREVLRRAQPSTLLLRYAPRQRQIPMDELLKQENSSYSSDPKGSLIDADMGTFYTWINHQRLTGAAQAIFIAWCQELDQAIIIAPGLDHGTINSTKITVKQLLDT